MQRPAGTKALAQGLEILRVLSEAPEPLSATAIAERLGVSVSTASRALGALTAAGYVRKPDYHSFAPSIGVVALAGNARGHFGLPAAQRVALTAQARATGWLWTIGTVHGGQLVYLVRVGPDHEAIELGVGSYPLHLSVIAMRLLLDLPEAEALAALRASRRRYGWEQPTPTVPADEATCLAVARSACTDGVLALVDWQARNRVAVALRLPDVVDSPRILAVVGGRQADAQTMAATLRSWSVPS